MSELDGNDDRICALGELERIGSICRFRRRNEDDVGLALHVVHERVESVGGDEAEERLVIGSRRQQLQPFAEPRHLRERILERDLVDERCPHTAAPGGPNLQELFDLGARRVGIHDHDPPAGKRQCRPKAHGHERRSVARDEHGLGRMSIVTP